MSLNKILIVDDSKLIHQMYRTVLTKYKGCAFLGAMNGLEALEILSKEKGIDLILLDINMPAMNGMQFMEKLKKDNLYRHIPTIIISAEGKEEASARAMRLGALGCIAKPFKSESLYELIDEVIANRPSVLMETGLSQ